MIQLSRTPDMSSEFIIPKRTEYVTRRRQAIRQSEGGKWNISMGCVSTSQPMDTYVADLSGPITHLRIQQLLRRRMHLI